MRLSETFVVLVGFLSQVLASTRITLDEEAQSLCKKYKRMCKTGKICAVQHFDWPNNITIPVCIPLSFVPVRNLICQLPPEQGSCSARYIRWYFNVHAQECTHFRYGGCDGNENNFMSKEDCENSCLSTPTVTLYEGSQHSALVQMKPTVMQPPVFESPSLTRYEPMNGGYNLMRHRDHLRNRNDETNRRKRRRLDKEKEKERRRRERKKEKRLRRLRKKKNRKNKKNKKDRKRKNGRNKKRKNKETAETENETAVEIGEDVVKGTESGVAAADEADTNAISNEVNGMDEKEMDKIEKRKERKRKKRRQRNKRRSGKNRNKRRLYKRYKEFVRRPAGYRMFSILDQGKQQSAAEQTDSELNPHT